MRRILALSFACAGIVACAAAESGSPKAPPAMSTPAGASGDPRHSTAMAAARADFDRAEIELSQAQSDCTNACKALASMERATEHLCGLVIDEPDKRACDEARQKLGSSRDRIRSSCGECPK